VKYFRQVLAVAAKDLRAEFRTKESINAAVSFAVVILLLFSFAMDPTGEQIAEMSGGLLWLVYAFAGALILNRSFARELPNDCLDVLVASPLPASALFLGKCVANYLLLVLLEIICLPVFSVFYNITVTRELLWMMAVFALATWGMTVVGTVFSALTVNLRLRELMLPMLIYPMLIPALMAAMKLTTVLVAGGDIFAEDQVWLRLLVAFDIIFTSLSVSLIDTVLVG
jgi:heme exporter protein B